MLPRVPQRAPPTDPKQRCRVCTKWGVSLVPFDGSSGSSSSSSTTTIRPQLKCPLPEAIAAVGGVRVEPGDRLPQYCCVFCLRQVESAYKLRQLALESDRTLREMFPEPAAEMVFVKVEEVFDMLGVDAVPIKEEPVEVPSEDPILPDVEMVLDTDPTQIKFEGEEEVEESPLVDSDASGDDSNDEDYVGNSGENEDEWYDKLPVMGIRCCGCKYTFKTKAELLAHRDTKHNARKLSKEQLNALGCMRVQCNVCYRKFLRQDLLRKHQAKVIFEFRCKACGVSFNRRLRAIRHFRIMHQLNEVGPIICCGCAESFTTSAELAAHSEAVHLPKRPPPNQRKTYECNVCYRSYGKDFLLYKHRLRITEEGTTFKCTECEKSFRHLHKLRQHEQCHRKTQCNMCPVTDPCPQSLQRHIESHKMADGTFKCFQCAHCFITGEGLLSHGIQQHTGERPHACPHCSATFAKQFELTIHMKSHLERKSFLCPHCGAGFYNASMLRNHTQFYHKEYECFFCLQSFSDLEERDKHMETVHPAALKAHPWANPLASNKKQ